MNKIDLSIACDAMDRSRVLHTNSGNADFLMLAELLDVDLNERYGELQKLYDQNNKAEMIDNVVVVYRGSAPAACGAFKRYDGKTAELKRIFVRKEAIRLYEKLGYEVTDNYGVYVGNTNSICMRKALQNDR